MQNELWADVANPGCFVWLQVFDSQFHFIPGELSREVGVDAGRPAYVIHFTDGLPGELLVGVEEPPVADQLHCDGVSSDGAWFWFCCLAGQLIDGLAHSLAGVGEVDDLTVSVHLSLSVWC